MLLVELYIACLLQLWHHRQKVVWRSRKHQVDRWWRHVGKRHCAAADQSAAGSSSSSLGPGERASVSTASGGAGGTTFTGPATGGASSSAGASRGGVDGARADHAEPLPYDHSALLRVLRTHRRWYRATRVQQLCEDFDCFLAVRCRPNHSRQLFQFVSFVPTLRFHYPHHRTLICHLVFLCRTVERPARAPSASSDVACCSDRSQSVDPAAVSACARLMLCHAP